MSALQIGRVYMGDTKNGGHMFDQKPHIIEQLPPPPKLFMVPPLSIFFRRS